MLLTSAIGFSVSGTPIITEDDADSDNNAGHYTIGYTGTLTGGDTASVNVTHVLNQTDAADYTTNVVAAITTAVANTPSTTFNGTTLTFGPVAGTTTSASMYAGAAATVAGTNTTPWTSAGAATGSNAADYANVVVANRKHYSDYLVLTNFGFNIPTNAIVNGITVTLNTTGSDIQRDGHGVQITKDGSNSIGTPPNNFADWSTGSVVVAGGLWGTTWQPSEINAAGFGMRIRVRPEDDGFQFRVRTAQIVVSYTTPGSSAPTSLNFTATIADDTIAEPDESYFVTLSNATSTNALGASITTASVTTTIIDNDAPDIDVTGKGISIVDGDTTPSTTDDTDFGTILFNAVGVTHTFTVKNTGTGKLTLGAPQLSLGFELGTNQLVGSLEPNTSDTFEVSLSSSAMPDIRSGEIVIPNDDADENPYNFAVKGLIKGYEISGMIRYDIINPKPVRGALVKAWDDGAYYDTLLGESYTDDNGRYTITTTIPATNILLRVYSQTAASGTAPGQVTRGITVEDSLTGENYYHEFYPPAGWSLSPSNPQVPVADTTIDDVTYSDQAFWAFDAGITASRFHATLPGVTPDSLEIQFPNPLGYSPYPIPGLTSAAYGGNVYLHSRDWNNWDVIIHEYGHLVAGEAGFFDITGNPGYWSHNTGVNARDLHPGMDYDDMMQLGFNEGWANFYSMVCQNIKGVTTPPVGNAGDGKFAGELVESPIAMHGEDEELSVMAILWDLYDPFNAAEPDDTIDMGIGPLFSLLSSTNAATGTKPATLDDLWDMLIARAPNLGTKFDYARIFELNQVSPVLQGASTAAVTSPSTAITMTIADGPPTFHWNIPEASDNTKLLNQFGIMIFDDTDALVYDSGARATGTGAGTVQVTGTAAVFTPSATEWTTNISSRVTSGPRTFRWVIFGEFIGDNFTSTILTGQYWSSNGEIIVTP